MHKNQKVCQKFNLGLCNRSDDECWFSHNKKDLKNKMDFQLPQRSAPPDRIESMVEELRVKMAQMEQLVSQVLQK